METNKTHVEDYTVQMDRSFEVEQLMGDLKETDRQYGGMVKRLIWLYGLMIPIYLVVFIFRPGATFYDRMEGVCFVAGFTIFFFVFRHLHKEFNFVNYGEPLIQVLKSVIKRYKKWQWPTYLAFAGVLLIDVGMCFSTTSDSPVPNLKTIIQFQLLFLPSIAIAALIGFLIWRKRHKPLVDKAKKLLKELE